MSPADLSDLDDRALRERLVLDTACGVAALEALRRPGPLRDRLARLFPELFALAVTASPLAALEHEMAPEGEPSLPLLDHLGRVLSRKLSGLEQCERARFQKDDALSADAFDREALRIQRLGSNGLLPCVRTALLYLDFAKGGDPAQRRTWEETWDADLTIHNLAARRILERAPAADGSGTGVLRAFPFFAERPSHADLVLALVGSHGLAGQAVRGETPLALFAPFVHYLRTASAAPGPSLGAQANDSMSLALDCLHAVNVCDTAGVREGLLDDALLTAIEDIERLVLETALLSKGEELDGIERELAGTEDGFFRYRFPGLGPDALRRARIADRLARLRQGRQRAGESRTAADAAVEILPDGAAARLEALLRNAQFWYAESATSALGPDAQLKIVALALRAAEGLDPVACSRPYHVSFLPLVASLGDSRDPTTPYRVRIVESLLASASTPGILEGSGSPPLLFRPEDSQTASSAASALGTFVTEIGRSRAVALTFQESAEASALLTLLCIYEKKSSAAFHATLKALCDLYGLRKDEFDRVANERLYLAHMNSSQRDKARLLEYVRPGRIVEVGPGGGVVLDLLAERFPESQVTGIDTSQMAIEALLRRKQEEGRRWDVIEADAFRLPELLGLESTNTVVFCSVLHEIYSYVEYPSDATGTTGRFRLEAVRDLIRAAYRTLVPAGRLVIRDGVMPQPGERILEFRASDAREFFDLFVREFEGRSVMFEDAGDGRVHLSTADAMEFLYTYVWGPESFPYEVREQYGVLPYDVYRRSILEWLAEPPHPARAIDLPPGQDHYLLDGYRRGLAGKVAVFDAAGSPVELPDSNALFVFEKS